MAAQLIQLPSNPVLDDGAVAAGAVVIVYATGTTTPVTVYTDSSLTTIAGLPQRTADANGVVGNLYFDNAATIRLVVTDSGGNAIHDIDPYLAGGGAPAEIAASSGSALVGYTEGGAGAAARTVQSRLRDYGPTSGDYGAPVGGTINSASVFAISTATAGTDASAELQALVDRAEDDKLPIIDIAPGTQNYSLLTAPILLKGDGKTVRGQRGMTYSRGTGNNGAFILGTNVLHGFRVGDGTTPSAPGANGADCYTFENIGFMRDASAPLKSQSGIYWNLQSNGPPRGVNLFGVSATGLLAGFELAPPTLGCTTMLANLTLDGVCLSNNRYGVFASGPLYGLRAVASQIEQNNAASAPANGLKTVTITAGGTGYTAGRRVWLTAADGTGRGASGTIAVSGGAVTGVTIDVEGFGYTVGETLNIVTGQGTGATATVATIGAPDQWEGGAIHGNIQGPISIVDNQIEGQPNPIDLQPIGGPLGVGGSANIAARVTQNYIETVNVNSSEFVGRFGTTERFHVNTLDWGPNFYAGAALPPDFIVINKRGNWQLTNKDRNAVTFDRWNGSTLRGSNIFGPQVDHFFVKGFSSDPNSAPEVFLGEGFNRHDTSGGNLTAAAVDAGGSGYTNGETVSLVGADGRGFGATATIAVTAGAITGFTIVLAGIGYVNGATLDVVGGTGTGGTATATAGATTPWTHSAPFASGELVHTGRGKLFARDATQPTPLGFGVTAGDLVVVTAYVSVQNRNASIFRGQVTRNSGSFLASINDSYADVISKGDWVHICYAFLAPSTVPDIAFKYGTSGGANTVTARIAGLCARNYGAYDNATPARQQIIPVAPRLV